VRYDIVYIAAWVIILKTIFKIVSSSSEEGRVNLEVLAVMAEFRDISTSEERKKALIMRHPGLLIPLPAGKYFAEAERQREASKPPLKDRIKDFRMSLIGCLIVLLLYYAIKFALSML
jgi:hypothetical protein